MRSHLRLRSTSRPRRRDRTSGLQAAAIEPRVPDPSTPIGEPAKPFPTIAQSFPMETARPRLTGPSAATYDRVASTIRGWEREAPMSLRTTADPIRRSVLTAGFSAIVEQVAAVLASRQLPYTVALFDPADRL